MIAELNERAWSFCPWQPPHTYFLVTDEECCAVLPPVPLWQAAHLLVATFLPACLFVWHAPHRLKPGLLAWNRWNAVASVWHEVHATFPACLWAEEWQTPHWVKPVAWPVWCGLEPGSKTLALVG